ncbi:MAG TPA: dipeptide epimerase [Aquiluna sp.]
MSGQSSRSVRHVSYRLATPFAISRGIKTHADVIQVEIRASDFVGRGEAVPYSRYAESVASCMEQIEQLPDRVYRSELQELLPAGAARNAVDLALLDLEAKQTGKPVWQLLGLPMPEPLTMGGTISLGSSEQMGMAAKKLKDLGLIKVKLGGVRDEERIAAVREAAPESRLLVDANEGWSIAEFDRLLPFLIQANVELIEQPCPASVDSELAGLNSPILLCADESFQGDAGIGEIREIFDFVNIKLDKSGGLTSGLQEVRNARSAGLGVMVGCMVSSSLGIAPAFLLAQLADYSDLDGFTSVEKDEQNGMAVRSGMLSAPESLWGYSLS